MLIRRPLGVTTASESKYNTVSIFGSCNVSRTAYNLHGGSLLDETAISFVQIDIAKLVPVRISIQTIQLD